MMFARRPSDHAGLGASAGDFQAAPLGPRASSADPAPIPCDAATSPPGGRLNLLLSDADWNPESWADRLPRLLHPLGVHSHRAQSGAEAARVLRAVRIHIAVVDLGLPLDAPACKAAPAAGEAADVSEGGARLLDLLRRLDSPPPTIVVKRARTHRDDARLIGAALRAGAFAVVERPRSDRDLELLLDALRRILCRHYQGRWPAPA